VAAQGVVGSYIHGGGKIGVLVEVNCETDFVARTDEFQRLVKDLAMQIAAANPRCVRREEVAEAERERERAIYRAQTVQSGKPAAVVERIVEGKLEKFYSEACLLEQPFIRDSSKTVEQLVKDAVSRTGENIVVRRFARFQIGEAEAAEDKSGQSA
jgi:elongation factor Ts